MIESWADSYIHACNECKHKMQSSLNSKIKNKIITKCKVWTRTDTYRHMNSIQVLGTACYKTHKRRMMHIYILVR